MDIRRFAPLRAAGATWKEIAAHAGCDWRTVKKYLSPDAPATPPRASSRAGTVPRLVDPFVGVIDAWLAADPRLRATVIHERLVADYGFTGHYQRVKVYVADARRRLELEADAQVRPPGLHRRFEVVAGAQAQVDWGDEGTPGGRVWERSAARSCRCGPVALPAGCSPSPEGQGSGCRSAVVRAY